MSGTAGEPTSATAPLSARAERSRQRILHAATELLAETGELEVAGVAIRAKVSDGLPYRYFATKSDLLAAVVDDFQQRLAKAVVIRDFPGATWQERECQRVSEWVRFLFNDPVAPVMLVGLGGDATVAASWQRHLSLAVTVGARNIARGQRNGDLPAGADPTILAAAVLGGVQAAVAVALASKPRPGQAKVARSLWNFVRGAVECQAPRRAAPEKPMSEGRPHAPVDRLADLRGDLAGTHRRTQSGGVGVCVELIDAQLRGAIVGRERVDGPDGRGAERSTRSRHWIDPHSEARWLDDL